MTVLDEDTDPVAVPVSSCSDSPLPTSITRRDSGVVQELAEKVRQLETEVRFLKAVADAVPSDCWKGRLFKLYKSEAAEWSLDGFALGAEGAAVVADALKIKSPQILRLRNAKLCDDGCEVLADALMANRTVVTLDLQGSNMHEKGAILLAETLKVNDVLQSLDVRNGNVPPEGVKAVFEVLRVNSSVREMNLGGQAPQLTGQWTYSDWVADVTEDTDGRISWHGRSKAGTAATFQGQRQGNDLKLDRKHTLDRLLYKPWFGTVSADGHVIRFSDGDWWTKVAAASGLGTADLGEFHSATQAIADCLKCNPALRILRIQGYNLGPRGAAALAAALEHNSTLQTLDLSGCGIGDGGAEALADALAKNSTLLTLNLDENHIKKDGFVSLAHTVNRRNTTLTALSLRSNHPSALEMMETVQARGRCAVTV